MCGDPRCTQITDEQLGYRSWESRYVCVDLALRCTSTIKAVQLLKIRCWVAYPRPPCSLTHLVLWGRSSDPCYWERCNRTLLHNASQAPVVRLAGLAISCVRVLGFSCQTPPEDSMGTAAALSWDVYPCTDRAPTLVSMWVRSQVGHPCLHGMPPFSPTPSTQSALFFFTATHRSIVSKCRTARSTDLLFYSEACRSKA